MEHWHRAQDPTDPIEPTDPGIQHRISHFLIPEKESIRIRFFFNETIDLNLISQIIDMNSLKSVMICNLINTCLVLIGALNLAQFTKAHEIHLFESRDGNNTCDIFWVTYSKM